MLELQKVGFQRGERMNFQDLQVTFSMGQFVGLIGPNGSGKTTLLHLLSGELRPERGEVLLEEQPLHCYTPAQLADRRALLTQQRLLTFPFTVLEVVNLGGFNRLRTRTEPPTHGMTTQEALRKVQVETYIDQLYPTLSGGEASRVDLARVLVQQTPVLLLDEPTNHLDPRYQVCILALCREIAKAGGLVIAALHDLNLAARFTSRLLLLCEGRLLADGVPEEVLCPDLLEVAYQVPFEVVQSKKHRLVIPDPNDTKQVQ